MNKASRPQTNRAKNPNKGRPKWANGNRKQSDSLATRPTAEEEDINLSDQETSKAKQVTNLAHPNSDSTAPTALDHGATHVREVDAPHPNSAAEMSAVLGTSQLSAETNTEQTNPATFHDKKEKRPEPQNLPEFLAAFLTGKSKSLPTALAKRLASSNGKIETDIEGDLLRRAQEADRSLERTRKLMLLAKELQGSPALQHQLMVFCRNVILFNPDVQSPGMKAFLFPEFEDQTTLEDAWRALLSLRATKQPESSAKLSEESTISDSTSMTIAQSTSKGGAKDGGSGTKATIARTQRNSLLCSAIWRMQFRDTTFAEMLRSLRSTIFALREKPQSLEIELFESIATLPDKEDERFGHLLEWSNRIQTEALQKVKAVERQNEELHAKKSAIEQRLQLVSEQGHALEHQLDTERAARAAADKAVGVAETHGQADLEEMRAIALIAIRDAVSQLDVVSAALGRDHPKVDSARDKVHAVMDVLKNTSAKLEDA